MTGDPFSPVASMELVAFRRLGYQRVHFALVMPDTLTPSDQLGAPFMLVSSPVLAFCARTIRGSLCCIPAERLDEWRRHRKICRECELVAALAVVQRRRDEVER